MAQSTTVSGKPHFWEKVLKENVSRLEKNTDKQKFNHDDEAASGDRPSSEKNLGKKVSVFGMVVFGLIEMVPIAPFAIFASVYVASNGMPSLAYLIAAIGMLFTVFSFGAMIPVFPSSGSIYTYASHTLCPAIGFIAGWLMLLQYLVTPDLMFIQAGQAINQYVPEVPVWGWCLMLLAFVATVSMRALKDTIAIDKIALVAELVVFGLFIVFGIAYIVGHPAQTSFSFNSFINPQNFDMSSLMNSVSLCALSFVGFGCVATLTEEAKDPRKGPAKSMLIIVITLAIMFVGMCFIASCILPGSEEMALMKANPNTGFYILAEKIASGGRWFGVVCAIANAIALGVFNGLVSTTAISRVIYVMSRSGALPKALGVVNKKTDVPVNATIFVNCLSLVLLFFLINFLQMPEVAKLSNFGALSTYCILNICVFWYCFVKKRIKMNLVRALILPALGALITGWIFFSIEPKVAIIGWIWVALGVVYYLVQTKVFKKEINLG